MNLKKNKRNPVLYSKKTNVLKVDPCGVCGDRVSCNSI